MRVSLFNFKLKITSYLIIKSFPKKRIFKIRQTNPKHDSTTAITKINRAPKDLKLKKYKLYNNRIIDSKLIKKIKNVGLNKVIKNNKG